MGKTLKDKLFEYMEDHDNHDLPSHYRETKLKESILDFNDDNSSTFDQDTQYSAYLRWLNDKYSIDR